jgi:hypothetical protein
MRRASLLFAAAVLVSFAAPRPAHADEFKLKDGSTIVGAVVGYEGNAFKVKTSYGYALVEKDKIVSIKIGSAPEPSSDKNPGKGAGRTAAGKPAFRGGKNAQERAGAETRKIPSSAARAEAKREIAAKLSSAAPSTNGSGSAPTAAQASKSSIPTAQPGRAVTANAAPAAVATAATGAPTTDVSGQPQLTNTAMNTPSAPPGPQPIREKISGNTYINDTYEFEMYKPPDWEVMDGARSVLPGAVAAMGTEDQTTYLVVGQGAPGKSAAADDAAMEQRLNDILVNYRPTGDEHLIVSGEAVIAHRFRGSMDEHDWSGFMVFLPHGAKLYTIFGMTRADNDLVQIQENVIRRTIASFQFLPQ